MRETRTIDTKLEVGSLADTVQVEATVEALNRTNAEVGGVIDSAQIKEIPVSGRNWASLTLLAPGAINYGDGAQRSIRFSGHSLDDNNFTFDGVDTSGVQEQTQKADTRLEHCARFDFRIPGEYRELHCRDGVRGRGADQRGVEIRHQRASRQRILCGAQRCPGLRARRSMAIRCRRLL